MDESTRMLLGLAIGIILMIVLVSKTKVHTFIALLMAAVVTGLIGGMPVTDITVDGTKITGIITSIQNGFGSTLKSTGIIIGLGVMMGGILEESGGAERMAYSFIKAVGKKKEEWALAITGWFISIPVFADSAIVIFAPLCKAMSRVTGKSVIGLALSLACGLQLTHCLVPPTPGPLTAASTLGVDVGQMIIAGALVSIPMLIIVMFYTKYIGKKIYQIPNDNGGFDRMDYKAEYIKSMDDLDDLIGQKNLPPLLPSVAPIVVPIILILLKTILDFANASNSVIDLLGSPIIALAIGTLLAIYGLARNKTKDETLKYMDNAMPAFASGSDPAPEPLPEITEEEPTTGGMEPEGVPITPKGNATLVDDFYGDKQLITVTTKAGNYFYILIDRANEDKETSVHFLNQVDDADLLALLDEEPQETEVCTCTVKCDVGDVNENCPLCEKSLRNCTAPEAVKTDTETPQEKPKSNMGSLMILLVLALAGGGAALYYFKFRKPKADTTGHDDLDEYDFGEDEDADEEPAEIESSNDISQ